MTATLVYKGYRILTRRYHTFQGWMGATIVLEYQGSTLREHLLAPAEERGFETEEEAHREALAWGKTWIDRRSAGASPIQDGLPGQL
jgi:hypothetical protein